MKQTPNPSKVLSRVIKIAVDGHADQYDKGGKPYILHPMRLMMKLRHESIDAQVVAIAHDVIEDTVYTFEDLKTAGVSPEALTALSLLTHKPSQSYADYIIEISSNELATMVKLRDLDDNSDLRRLKGVTQKDLNRMAKYQLCYYFLQGKTSEAEFKNAMNELGTK